MFEFWVIAAGTGGHIYPGVVLAERISTIRPHWKPVFFGTKDRLEAKIIPELGHELRFLKSGRWKGSGFLSKFVTVLSVAIGFFQSLLGILRGPRPTCIISVGGYVSVPVVLACWVCRVPIFLLEPNIRSGLANRLLSRLAKKAFTVPGGDALENFRCQTFDMGNPVRSSIQVRKVDEFTRPVRRVLILGGSQGARSLCEAVLDILESDRSYSHIFVLQTGAANLTASIARQQKLDLKIEIVDFIKNMGAALSEVDLVVARAGATTVAELCLLGAPVIFVPYPHAADDHQRYNARLLERSGACVVVEEGEGFAQRLEERIRMLAADSELRQKLAVNIKKWARPQADDLIAQQILSVLA